MSKIKILDGHLTNMIAAGEVVERPAGIIKELIENSLDAQAKNIQIYYESAGMESLTVSDDGIGMSKEDLRSAFKRHSTSKIYKEDDLNRIQSFGFRGEALPSIASVSHVVCQSNNGDEGYEIILNQGKIEALNPFARNQGTSFTVSNLFFNVPARLKHIKNLNYESAIIIDIVQKFALSHPEVSFRLYNNGTLNFQSMGDGNLLNIYYQIYGRAVAEDSRYFSAENYDFKINGIYSLPNHNRANRYAIWLYINGRMIRYSKAQNAIIDAYRRHLAPNRYPIVMMNIETDPSLVDVNVHPSKWEIRLSQEKSLVNLILNSLESELFDTMEAPKIKIEAAEQTTFIQEMTELQNQAKIEKLYEEVNKEDVLPLEESSNLDEFKNRASQEEFSSDYFKEKASLKSGHEKAIESLKVLSQMSGKYILAQGEKGLYIIDQHAAMERIRYEYYQEKLLDKKSPVQNLLIPLVIQGRQDLISQLEAINRVLEQFQIQIELIGKKTMVIRSIPQWIKEEEIQSFVEDILDQFQAGKTIREEDIKRDSLASLACHSSVRFNEYLSQQEMEKLVYDLKECKQPYHCPHGRPTFLLISHQQLIKEFKR